MKKIPMIKEYRMLNGRQVPIYKYVYMSDAEYEVASEEALKRLVAAEKSAADKTPEELGKVLEEHAKEFTLESAENLSEKLSEIA